MTNGIKVKKRNGTIKDPIALEKMHKMVEVATEGLVRCFCLSGRDSVWYSIL